MKTHARVIVIGGGSVGCSALYHLTQLGLTDVVLLERDELTAGSTWHAAGNCPNFSTSWNVIKLQRHSTRLYSTLAEKVGYDINYHVTGSVRLAHTRDRVDEFRHVVSQAHAQGIEFEMLSPAEIVERHPFVDTDRHPCGPVRPARRRHRPGAAHAGAGQGRSRRGRDDLSRDQGHVDRAPAVRRMAGAHGQGHDPGRVRHQCGRLPRR